MEELMERLRENERQMQEQAKSWEERLQETKAAADAQVRELSQQGIHLGEEQAQLEEKRKTLPHLFNLNEDPLMSGVVVYFLEQSEMRIGRKDAARDQDVCLSGLSISKEHAVISMAEANAEGAADQHHAGERGRKGDGQRKAHRRACASAPQLARNHRQ